MVDANMIVSWVMDALRANGRLRLMGNGRLCLLDNGRLCLLDNGDRQNPIVMRKATADRQYIYHF